MSDPEDLLAQARQLTARLERLSADSIWARRASGYRASLLKATSLVEKLNSSAASQKETAQLQESLDHLDILLHNGQQILELAARDLIRKRTRRTS